MMILNCSYHPTKRGFGKVKIRYSVRLSLQLVIGMNNLGKSILLYSMFCFFCLFICFVLF